MSRFSFGLRRRLLLIGAIAIVPGLLLVFDANREQRRFARGAAEQEALAGVRQLARSQERTLDRARALVGLLAASPLVRDAPPETCSSQLAAFRQAEPRVWVNLGTAGMDGQVRCSAIPLSATQSVASDPFVQSAIAARSREVVSSDYLIGPLSRRPILGLIALIWSEQNEVQGVAFASLDLGWLEAIFKEVKMPAGTQMTLVDRQGRVLARYPAEPQSVGRAAPEAANLRQAAAGRQEGITRLPGREKAVYAFYNIPAKPGPGLLVYASVPAATVYAPANDQLRHNLLALLAALLAMVGGGLLAGQRFILRPVGRLQVAARRLSEGDLGARAGLGSGRDEITELGAGFDRMAEALQAREAALRRLNRIYAVLSSVNGLIIRAERREELLDDACRIAVDQGGYRLAWIGLLERAGRCLEAVRSCGGEAADGARLVPREGLAVDAWPELAEVFTEGKSVVYPRPGQPAHWQLEDPELPARGYAACVVLPLRFGERMAGCVCLHAAEADAFDAAEMKLLEEMTADISHALAHIDQAERLSFLANNDLLTGLPNAARFGDRLAMTLNVLQDSSDAQLAVLVVGLQGLRDINSVHGLPTGDQVLRESARRLRELLPAHAIMGRLRSGVFGAILPRAEAAGAAATIAGQILDAFRLPFQLDTLVVYVGVNVGISLAPMDGTDGGQLIQHAETALASMQGRIGRFRFYIEELQQQAERRLGLERGLRAALVRDDELYLLYQPVVAVANRQLAGVEALVRWRHPQKGELSPAQFIPLAEAAGLIVPLGEWVFRQACRQVRAWADAGLGNFKVAVNVSVSQLRHAGFLASVDAVLKESGVDPHRLSLGLEITESELMEDAEATIALLAQLKARGFSLSMDDFGTGYSSLAYLRRFPLDTLKIDIAFIRELASDPVSASIVQAIIALAQALELETVAEGVETMAQFERLARCGCTLAQGHLFGRAMSPQSILELAGRPLASGDA